MTRDMTMLLACLPHAPGWRYDWAGLRGLAPLRKWIDDMAATPQNPDWHAEGDVWTHTRMVCEALANLPQFREMPD